MKLTRPAPILTNAPAPLWEPLHVWGVAGADKMRTVRHPVFTFTSLLSALLCGTAVVLWVQSYFVADTDLPVLGFFSSQGGFTFYRAPYNYRGSVQHSWSLSNPLFILEKGYDATSLHPNWAYWCFGCMYWEVFLVTSILPIWWIALRWRGRVGHCRNCSYDLTGNTSGTCPECGSPIGIG